VTSAGERAALVALVRGAAQRRHQYAHRVEEEGSAIAVLAQERGLFAGDELGDARREIAFWERSGLRVLTLLDTDYPENLRAVYDRPPLLFVAGELTPADARSVAVIGSRRASSDGLARARITAEGLIDAGYVIVSGLAAGIDTAAHLAAFAHGGRTIAVIGTGLGRCYPAENRELQRRIAAEGAVVSQFWPDSPPSRGGFPMRNAVMSGLAEATVVIEASETSGSRSHVRSALAHGRPVFLLESLLEQEWARACVGLGGVHVVRCAAEIVEVIDRLTSPEPLVA
jgi:DNA processing protein